MVKTIEECPKSDKNCHQHPKTPAKYFCLDCKAKSCIHCIDKHAGHQFKSLQTLLSELIAPWRLLSQSVNKCLASLQTNSTDFPQYEKLKDNLHKTQKKCARLQKAFWEQDLVLLIESKADLEKYTTKSVEFYRQNKKVQEQQKRSVKRQTRQEEKPDLTAVTQTKIQETQNYSAELQSLQAQILALTGRVDKQSVKLHKIKEYLKKQKDATRQTKIDKQNDSVQID